MGRAYKSRFGEVGRLKGVREFVHCGKITESEGINLFKVRVKIDFLCVCFISVKIYNCYGRS